MTRCKHDEARPSTRLDEWLFCPSCRQFLKPRETQTARFAQEGH